MALQVIRRIDLSASNRLRLARGRWSPLLALALLTIVAYLPVMNCGFVWDDDAHLTENRSVQSSDGLWTIWTSLNTSHQYYPLVFSGFWIEYRLWGLDPAGYHATNLALHLLTAMLVYCALLQLGACGTIAWLTAAIFAVHPVHVESVAWVAERKNVQSAAFYCAALVAYLRYDELSRSDDVTSRTQRGIWYVLSLLLFLGALTSKTVTASLPVALALAMWVKHGAFTGRDMARVAPFALCGICFGLLTLWVEREYIGAVGSDWRLSAIERVLIAGRSIVFYATKLVVPSGLTFVYPRWDIDSSQLWQFLFPLGVIVSLGVVWGTRRRLGRGPIACILFFVATLVPALGLFNVFPQRYSFVADHFQYLASIGFIAFVVIGAVQIARRHRYLLHFAAIATIVSLATLTWQRTLAFHDEESIWRDTLAKNPTAWIAYQNLGVILLSRGELESAEQNFKCVLQLQPGNARAYNNLANLSLVRGDATGAIDNYTAALTAEPDYVSARLNLCKTLLAMGRVAEASEQYLHALSVDSDVAVIQSDLGLLLLNRADSSAAARFYHRAIRLVPNWALLTNERAWLLATSPDATATELADSLRLAQHAARMTNRRDPNVLDTLAAAYAADGQFDDAIVNAERALSLVEHRQTQLAEDVRSRLTLYRERKPYQRARRPLSQ